MTFFMDQISEHQRDLTNSASQRFVADYLAGFALAASADEERGRRPSGRP
jgi:adenylosuccinate lyase